MAYSLDTSTLIGAWVRSYPPDIFPGLWDTLAMLSANGTIVSPDEVRVELTEKADDLHEWATEHLTFVPLDEAVMTATRGVLSSFPRLVGELSDRNRADPFVIALAQVRSLTVVTEEKGGTDRRPRIPYVCAQLSVPCIGTLDFIRALGLTFSAGT